MPCALMFFFVAWTYGGLTEEIKTV